MNDYFTKIDISKEMFLYAVEYLQAQDIEASDENVADLFDATEKMLSEVKTGESTFSQRCIEYFASEMEEDANEIISLMLRRLHAKNANKKEE